jgi:hypothetical protein
MKRRKLTRLVGQTTVKEMGGDSNEKISRIGELLGCGSRQRLLAKTKAMSLITKKTRIDAKRVAEIIGCSRKTVLNGGAGTARLTRIRNGTRQIRFILEEVLAFAEKQEQHARRSLPSRTNDQETHGHRQLLSI